MQIKILKTFEASIDGFNITNFKEGEILNKNDHRLTEHFLTWAFANKGFIEEIKEEKMLNLKIENKAIFNAPENKEEEVNSIVETEELAAIPENKEEEVKNINKKKGKK